MLTRSTWIRLGVTAAVLGYLASRVDMGEALRGIVQIEPWHLVAVLALVALDRALMIWRWVMLLDSTGTSVPVPAAASIFLVSSFVGSFLPAGVGGDAARAYSLSRMTSRGSHAVASVAVDRLLGIVSIALLGALGEVLWSRRADQTPQQSLVAVAILVATASVAAFWVDVIVRRLLPPSVQARPWGVRSLRLVDAVAQYRQRPGALTQVFALSLAVQVLRVVQAFLLGRGLGIGVSFGYYLVFMPIGLLMLLLPLSISGFGLPQGVIVWLLHPQGVPDTQSFALSTLIILTGLAGNLPGAWLYLRRGSR